jgi:hypothetical protein
MTCSRPGCCRPHLQSAATRPRASSTTRSRPWAPGSDALSGAAIDASPFVLPGRDPIREPRDALPPADGLAHGVEQLLVFERLGEKIDGSSLHRADRHGNVAMAGYEDGGNVVAIGDEISVEVQTVHTRQADVEQQTACVVDQAARKQLARGCERRDPIARRLEQSRQSTSHREIVVYLEHDWLGRRHDPSPPVTGREK